MGGHHHHHGLDLPSLTIGGLKPRTKYSVRVAVYEDYETRTLGTSTPVIDVDTDGESSDQRNPRVHNPIKIFQNQEINP